MKKKLGRHETQSLAYVQLRTVATGELAGPLQLTRLSSVNGAKGSRNARLLRIMRLR